jgi:hypothetical protein
VPLALIDAAHVRVICDASRPMRDSMPDCHRGACGAGRAALGLESNGNVKGCPSLPSDHYVGGNVREHSLKDLWERSAPLRFMRDRSIDDLWRCVGDGFKAPLWASVVLRSDLLAVPPKDGLRRRERRHVGQKLSAEGLSLLGEQPSLGVDEAKTLGPESGPQHAVLSAQVLDRFALPATDPVGDQQDKKLTRPRTESGIAVRARCCRRAAPVPARVRRRSEEAPAPGQGNVGSRPIGELDVDLGAGAVRIAKQP